MNETWMTLVGNVAGEVRHHSTPNGVPVASFRMATSSRRLDRGTGEWRDADTSFLTVNCWRSMASNVETSLTKGDPVVVHGKFRIRRWEKDGRTGIDAEVDAVAVGHDLSRGTTMFRPVKRSAVVEVGGAPGLVDTATGEIADETAPAAEAAA